MNDHFFVLMYATSGEERNVTRFASYTNVQDVVDMVNDWLTKCCYMDCYLPGEQEETLKAKRRQAARNGIPVPGGQDSGGPGEIQRLL